MNVELLLKVKQHILEEPKRLNMHNWIERYPEEEVKSEDYLPSCGTTGCIAGWSFLLGLNDKATDISFDFYKTIGLLDISNEEADRLFYVQKWPSKFYNKYDQPTPTNYKNRQQYRAQVTAERIQHFIDTRK